MPKADRPGAPRCPPSFTAVEIERLIVAAEMGTTCLMLAIDRRNARGASSSGLHDLLARTEHRLTLLRDARRRCRHPPDEPADDDD